MKTNPVLSIIIPTLNEERYLPNLLEDLSKQTFENFEVIIVDARSDDNTKKEAIKYKRLFKSFRFIESDRKNVSHQRNMGTEYAKTDWFIFFDADNRIPNYFLQGIKYQIEMQKPDILSTWIEPDTNKKKDIAVATLINLFIEIQQKSANPFLLEAFICINKSAFNKLGGFDTNVYWGEGLELVRRAVKVGIKFIFNRNPKYIYSFRRIRKQGAFKLFRNAAQMELARFTNSDFSKELSKRLYPMEGGKYFDIQDKPLNKIEDLIQKIFKVETAINFKPSLTKKAKSYLAKVFQNKV